MEIRGSCECGEVTFSVTGPLSASVACHCSQCRKTIGRNWAAAGEGTASISAGTLDDLSIGAMTVAKHIFIADKETYYDVADGLPQSESW